MQHEFEIRTQGPGLYELTADLRRWLASVGGLSSGLLTLFVRHTSCSLLIQENADPEVQTDLQAFFTRLVPPSDHPSMGYLRHTYEGPDDMPAHIKAAMMPVSLSIPISDGTLGLGAWQGVYLFEHRQAPHQRKILAHLSA
ncbi:secondary thiamine-phosphate synthase enzyme YjbQ [Pseudophaeobacter flagellatus]|uniref:secondary thiamine-phosphate synthase enzyme YjbQ n=1 Tax=Pseudophaeobacter flagellatus TaxID=2899119 RepID=UPI001E61F0C1|nr:secondary thiamine-phosphate synthase enzyme YjbQ [Pseudophaeobacter flagellatus]MCD9148645.1 secondary thiamine-phosphate synthase enzyme YjbQ [Pseudophaeobacter flagellatus]